MSRETDLLRVKLVAHTLLDVQIQETALSPVIVSHPFTSSGISALRNEDGSLSMVDLINNSDDCTRWRRKVGEQIDSAENVHQIFVLLNPPYYLTFIKFAASDLSEKDLGQLLSIAWTQEECPNQDCNVSKRELVALFRSVSPEFLMDEEERTAHQALEDTVTVYRGVTPYNAKNIRALSWTLDWRQEDAHEQNKESEQTGGKPACAAAVCDAACVHGVRRGRRAGRGPKRHAIYLRDRVHVFRQLPDRQHTGDLHITQQL